MNDYEKCVFEQLKQIINVDAIKYDERIAPNIQYRVLVFWNFSPTDSQQPISVILPLPARIEERFPNQIWINCEPNDLAEINGTAPKYHPQYHSITLESTIFNPFSVNLDDMKFTACKCSELLGDIYNHYEGRS